MNKSKAIIMAMLLGAVAIASSSMAMAQTTSGDYTVDVVAPEDGAEVTASQMLQSNQVYYEVDVTSEYVNGTNVTGTVTIEHTDSGDTVDVTLDAVDLNEGETYTYSGNADVSDLSWSDGDDASLTASVDFEEADSGTTTSVEDSKSFTLAQGFTAGDFMDLIMLVIFISVVFTVYERIQ